MGGHPKPNSCLNHANVSTVDEETNAFLTFLKNHKFYAGFISFFKMLRREAIFGVT